MSDHLFNLDSYNYNLPESLIAQEPLIERDQAKLMVINRRTGQIKQGEEIIGNRTKVKVVKNKIAPPFRIAEFDIMYNKGISKSGDVLDLAADKGIVEKSGAWYAYKDAKIGQGREATKKYLEDNPKVLDEIAKKVLAAADQE